MGWCPECEHEGSDPNHTRTAGEGLCEKHRRRAYRRTEAGKFSVKKANDKHNPKRKTRSVFSPVIEKADHETRKEAP